MYWGTLGYQSRGGSKSKFARQSRDRTVLAQNASGTAQMQQQQQHRARSSHTQFRGVVAGGGQASLEGSYTGGSSVLGTGTMFTAGPGAPDSTVGHSYIPHQKQQQRQQQQQIMLENLQQNDEIVISAVMQQLRDSGILIVTHGSRGKPKTVRMSLTEMATPFLANESHRGDLCKLVRHRLVYFAKSLETKFSLFQAPVFTEVFFVHFWFKEPKQAIGCRPLPSERDVLRSGTASRVAKGKTRVITEVLLTQRWSPKMIPHHRQILPWMEVQSESHGKCARQADSSSPRRCLPDETRECCHATARCTASVRTTTRSRKH